MKKETSLLIQELEELAEDTSHHIPVDYVLEELQITFEEWISLLYREFHLFDLPESFHKENLDLLIEILKYYKRQDILRYMKKLGFYLTEEEFWEWIEHYISITLSILENHQISEEVLKTSITATTDIYEGLLFYCYFHFEEDYFFKKSAGIFLSRKNIKPNEMNLYLLNRYIQESYERKILSDKILYRNLILRLLDYCLQKSWITKEKIPFTFAGDTVADSDLKILELEKLPETREELQRVYRNLLKKYHPDRNPEGNEKTLAIINAYTSLLKKYYENV